MMKKLVLAALALCALAAPAFAQNSSFTRWTFEDLKFRNYRAANPAPGFIDSTYASGIAKFDTTTAISTDGWAHPAGVGGAVDSATTCRLLVFDSGLFADVSAGKTSATAESLYVKAQVSPNGVIWFDVSPIPGNQPVLNAWTLIGGANPGVVAQTSSLNTGISDKMWSIKFSSGQSAASRRDAIDYNNMHTFPYIRFILSGHRTLNHAYKARVMFPSASDRQ